MPSLILRSASKLVRVEMILSPLKSAESYRSASILVTESVLEVGYVTYMPGVHKISMVRMYKLY